MGVTTLTQQITIWTFTVDGKGRKIFTNEGVFPARQYSKRAMNRDINGGEYQTNYVVYTSYVDIAIGQYIALGDFSLEPNPVESSSQVKDTVYSDMFPDEAKAVY